MAKLGYFTLFISLLLFCSCIDFTQENKKYETENLAIEEIIFSDRNGSLSRWSVDNSPLIEVKVEYVGKSPALPTNSSLPSYDWKSKNTDFYNIKIKNLTNSPIRLLKTINTFQFGPSGEYFDPNYISNRYGSSTIPANGTISRQNSWIWGKGEHNKMEQFFWAKIDDSILFDKKEFQFTVRTYFNR